MHTAKPKYTFFRFYMVSESKGWFPAGTDCSGGEGQTKYCVKETDIIHTQFITRMCVWKQFFCQSPSPVTSSVRYISPLPECQMMKIINFGFSYWEMSKGKHGASPPPFLATSLPTWLVHDMGSFAGEVPRVRAGWYPALPPTNQRRQQQQQQWKQQQHIQVREVCI